jgi:hypothetical protein
MNWMDPDEDEICRYLKGWPRQFISATEIARRAGGKKRFREEPNWAIPRLLRLVEKGILESDAGGHYRLKARDGEKKRTRWLCPQVRAILEASGKGFDGVFDLDEVEVDARI